MCGIFGYISKESVDLRSATEIILHRGPDSEGFLNYLVKDNRFSSVVAESANEKMKISFGFRRLSIIDLSHSSDQPFLLEKEGFAIVFNGEIYNYIELRNELIQHGHVFTSNSDTEVLLRSYIQWGEECLNKFNGMWAFAILNCRNNEVFCARDRFGIKPFYYYKNAKALCFGSEIKQLLTTNFEKKLNERVIKDFLEKTISDHTEETFFEGIKQLLPGHKMRVKFTGEEFSTSIERYWEIPKDKDVQHLSYAEACNRLKELLLDSVKLRFRSDVPVGSCLSGGLDSSSIVSVAAKYISKDLNTFTARYLEKEFDETLYVKALNDLYPDIKSHYCSLTEDLFIQEIESVIWHQDEPFGTLGILSQWEVMKLAKKNGITTLLDGQGGDEVLGGYRKYYAFYLRDLLRKREMVLFTKEALHLIKNSEFNFFNKEGIKRYLNKSNFNNYLSDKGQNLVPLANIGIRSAHTMKERSILDIEKYSYPPLLRYEDRNSMAFSLEARVPFMDYRVVSFLHSVPDEYIIRDGYTKAILRDSMTNILPDKTRLRKSKLGFSTPQNEWMKAKLNPYFRNYFQKMDNPYLNNKAITNDFINYPDSKLHSWDFSRFYIFDKWFNAHF